MITSSTELVKSSIEVVDAPMEGSVQAVPLWDQWKVKAPTEVVSVYKKVLKASKEGWKAFILSSYFTRMKHNAEDRLLITSAVTPN